MAEAHAAVAFSFAVTREGFDVNVNYEAMWQVWASGVRSWKKRVARWKNGLRNGMYPARPGSLLAVISVVICASVMGYDVTTSNTGMPLRSLCARFVPSPHDIYATCVLFSLLTWLVSIFLFRCVMLVMLSYKSYMFEPRGRMSMKSKLWFAVMKLIASCKPGLFSFQGFLPRLPLPAVDDTMRRYLRSVRPFMDDEKYGRMEVLAREFQDTIAARLQRYLMAKSWWAANYVSDWWEEYVYLHGRAPIIVNSNFYGVDAILRKPTEVQAARAGSVTFHLIKYMRSIDREEMAPIMLNGIVPLCSTQYERQFMTTRIPGIEKDTVVRFRDSEHVAVLSRGAWYKLYFFRSGVHLTPAELQRQFQFILDNDATAPPVNGEDRLAAMTAGDRVPWAQARRLYFRRGVNRTSLDAIEKAAFVVVLSEESHCYDAKDPSKLNAFAHSMLHGQGNDRWFDKSFNIVVCKNAQIGFNAEHSWADSPVMSLLWEYLLSQDLPGTGYDEQGNCRGKMRDDLDLTPVRLAWDFDKECIAIMEQQFQIAKTVLSDVELYLAVHNQYGKGYIKSIRQSPDAYIQLALQLAYFRDAARFCLTYEASMTRMYRDGRTETVRSCSNESAAFCEAMDAPTATLAQRYELFCVASERHQQLYREAMTGMGVDRHLFCLYVMTKYLGLESPFLKEVLAEPWRLSTSQTPHGQTDGIDLARHPDFICAGGGFGPVADDGYGVSYIIAGDGTMFFHVSSKISCSTTNSERFAQRIVTAMQDLRTITEGAAKPSK